MITTGNTNGRVNSLISSKFCPSKYPAQASASDHGNAPINVKMVKRGTLIRETPAGIEMKMSHARYEAPDQNRDFAARRKPAVGSFDVLARDQQVLPVPLDQRASASPRRVVFRQRSNDAADTSAQTRE